MYRLVKEDRQEWINPIKHSREIQPGGHQCSISFLSPTWKLTGHRIVETLYLSWQLGHSNHKQQSKYIFANYIADESRETSYTWSPVSLQNLWGISRIKSFPDGFICIPPNGRTASWRHMLRAVATSHSDFVNARVANYDRCCLTMYLVSSAWKAE